MTVHYQKIMLAVDFNEDSRDVVETAKNMASLYQATLLLVHVNERVNMAYAAEGVSWGDQIYSLEVSIRKESQKKMSELAKELGVPTDLCHLVEGRPAPEIHQLCEELDVDLVILGTHGQAGLQLLLGSTANSVLHGSRCDVLAVRLRE